MNRSSQWDASGPPVASGQVPFYNPAQFQPDHSTGSAVAPSSAFGDAGHGAVSADYAYGWENNWNSWPHAEGYNSAGYDGNYYFEQQRSAESGAEGEVLGDYRGAEQVYDPSWSMNQPYPMQYPMHYAPPGEYSYDPMIVGAYNNVATDTINNSHVDTSQSAMLPYASHALEDGIGVSPFFHAGSEASSTGLLPQVAPPDMMMEGSSEQLPAVNSFSNIHQPSPFDELGDMKTPRAGLLEQFVLPSSHSRQSSAGGGVQFLIGGSSNVSESPSRTDSPHAVGIGAACSGTDNTENRTAVTEREHVSVPQPHFTDAGSHKTLTGRMDDSPVRSQLPQGTMTGTQASGPHRMPASGPSTPPEHPHWPSDFAAAVASDADGNQVLSCSASSESVHAEAGISEDIVTAQQPTHHPVNESEMSVNAEDVGEPRTDVYAGLLGSHPDSLFTPVGKVLAVNAAVSPAQQQFAGGCATAVPPTQAGSVCSAAGSDGGVLDMHEIELDAMVDSGSPQDVVRRVEAGSGGESVAECGSGTSKQSAYDATPRSHLHHHHAKAHREATMSPATTLWENPEPTGVQLLPAPAASRDWHGSADRLPTHELLQNTDAGPSKSAASGVVHEPSLDVHSAKHSVDDQRVPQALPTSFSVSQTSHASSVNHSVPSQVASESSSHTSGHQLVVQPAATSSDVSGTVQNESVDLLSDEPARSHMSSASHHGHAASSVPAKPSHVAVVQTSGKPTSELVTTEPSGSILASGDAIPGPRSSELRPSAGTEVDQSRGMEAVQTADAREPSVQQVIDHDQQPYDKSTQGNVHTMQSKSMNVHKGFPYEEEMESSDVAASSQRLSNQEAAHQAYDDAVHAVKSERQDVPSSVPYVPDEQRRYRAENDRPRSRQAHLDQVSRRPSSRQDDDRAYNRSHSRQHYDDQGYDRPRSTHGYDVPPYRQMSEDPYGRPRSRQGYEDPYYYRPRSRQEYDYRRDMPGSAGHSYIYPEEGHLRQGYHEPVDRPRSQQEYDRPRSRQEYEDWPGRGSRDHYRNNRYGDPDSHNRQGSKHDERDPREAHRYPDESFNRSRYSAPEEGYDKASWNSQEDSSYRASQGYREEEHRRPRSRGGGKMLFA